MMITRFSYKGKYYIKKSEKRTEIIAFNQISFYNENYQLPNICYGGCGL